MAPPAPAPRTARSRLAAARPARALALAACLAAAVLAACPAPALGQSPAAKAAANPTHAPLTPVESRYNAMLMRLLTEETPADAALVVVGMLQTYAAPTGPTAPGCLVSPTAARRFRQLPVPSAKKWEGLFSAMGACRSAAAGRAGACTQSALDGFGIGTPGAQRDFTHLFFCELICGGEEGEGCEGGKDCKEALSFGECSKAPKKAAAPGGVSAPKGASYYYLDQGRKRLALKKMI